MFLLQHLVNDLLRSPRAIGRTAAIVAVAFTVALAGGSIPTALAAPAGFVTASGTHLELDGLPYRFTGINIYNANNASGCWYPLASGPDLDNSLGAIGSGGKVIRAWFFQSLATTGGVRDWSGFDHTLSVAATRGVKVIVTLENQWNHCSGPGGGAGVFKNKAWYDSGYTNVDPGLLESYRDYVAAIVARYKDDPTILAWQLMNEAESADSYAQNANGGLVVGTCSSDAGAVLRTWAQNVSGLVKSIDPNHLVSIGTIGSGQCGAGSRDEYRDLHSLPTVDLCEWHDYGYPTTPMPGTVYNGLQDRINQCNAIDKPLFVGETGIKPSEVGGTEDRAVAFRAKLAAQFAAGVVGELVWAWNKDGGLLTDYDIGPGDPLLATLAAFRNASEPAATSVSDLSGIQKFAISHDGMKLAMAATLNGIPGLYTADRDGTNVYLLAAERPGFYAIGDPDFSPDDQTIAFTAFGNPGGGDLFTIDAAGGSLVNLTRSELIDEESPRYSPDGSSIVVVSADGASNNTLAEIRTIDTQTGVGTEILNLYPDGGGVSGPTYASDGQSILFSMNDGLGQWQIASIPAAGGSVTPLTAFTNGTSGFGPDSSRSPANNGKIAFFSSLSGGRELHTMDADGGNPALIFTDPYVIGDVHWTPSGGLAYLATSIDNQGAHPHLHVPPAPVSASVPAGGSISSALEPTEIAPISTAVMTPVAGAVSIESALMNNAPAGYSLLGEQVVVSAPAATPADPLVLTFRIDATLLGSNGLDASSLVVFRNGTPLAECDPLSTGALPDPCVASRVTLGDGDAELTVRTSQASTWAFGMASPSLDGEYFLVLGGFIVDSYLCGADGSGTITFSTAGTATGPFPGPFTETGTVVLGPTPPPASGITDFSPVTAFSSSFTINSSAGTVTGTRTLTAPIGPIFGTKDLVNKGECLAGPFTTNQFGVDVTYDATITTTAGVSSDSGIGHAFGAENRFLNPPNLFEGYFAASPVVDVPQPPGNVVGAAGDGTASVGWVPPANDGGGSITSYSVIASPGGGVTNVSGTETTASISGLTNGTTYTFTVTATNVAGASEPSAASNPVTPQAGSSTPSVASGTAPPGGTLTTDPTGAGPSISAPVATAVTTPTGGTVTIAATTTTDAAPTGFVFGNQQVNITAPPGTPDEPLRIVFSIFPQPGQTPENTSIYRSVGAGAPTLVPPCDPIFPDQAVPDPCIAASAYNVTNTAIDVTILSSTASRWNEATPSPGAVIVSDRAFSPRRLTLSPGATATWSFTGAKRHSATDRLGLGPSRRPLFDSGRITSGEYTADVFNAAGTYPYTSTVMGDTMDGSISVPVLATPSVGSSASTFSIIWATKPVTGYVFDAQVRFKAASSKKWTGWATLESGVTTTHTRFTPGQGAGAYEFRARLHNIATGRTSDWSPETGIAVS